MFFTITTITMKIMERAHVIPLGFERSVAVKPIGILGGTRAHVITVGGEFAARYDLSDKQRYFERVVMSDLKECGLRVEVHHADLFDFRMAVGEISRVILKEKRRGSEVYVNISSHGRLISVASALAGWHHGARVYYVFPDRYARDEEEEMKFGRSVCKEPRIFEVPPVSTVKLSDEERLALSLIYTERGNRGYVLLDDIKEMFRKEFPEIYSERMERDRRREEQKLITKINRRVLDKLESRGYIERSKIGRKRILRLTELGEFIALLDGVLTVINGENG